MNPTLWIIDPWGKPVELSWSFAVEHDFVGLQRLSFRQWDDLWDFCAGEPCPI